MKLSELTWESLDTLTFEQKYLAVHGTVRDDGVKSDLIILLGGDLCVWDDRIETAARLFHEGRAKKVLITGCVVRNTEDQGPIIEAFGMANRLEKLGVPREAMILEPEARTTQENFIYGALLIYRHIGFDKVRDVTVVTSYSHMRRSLALARLFLPDFVTVHGAPSVNPQEYAPLCEDHPHYSFRVHEELRLLHILVRSGQIADIEIPEI